MLIGELANRSGLTRDTIRFYEKQQLIKVGRRDRRVNNYKEYSESVLRRLILLKKIKSFGFTLNESAEMISLMDANLASCERFSNAASQKILSIDEKIKELKALKNMLRTTVDSCMTTCCETKSEENCELLNQINIEACKK